MHIPSFLLAPKPKTSHSYQESKPLTPFTYLIRNSAFSTLTFSERSNSQKERRPQAIGVNGRILLHCLIFSLYSFVGKKKLDDTHPARPHLNLNTNSDSNPDIYLYKPHAKNMRYGIQPKVAGQFVSHCIPFYGDGIYIYTDYA